jgi:putative acetyltransferase
MAVSIRREDLAGAAARTLIAALNRELTGTYPEPGATHFGLDLAEVVPDHGGFFVVYQGERPVGCGAIRLIDRETAELKRMYVELGVRGTGIGRQLLEVLEAEARALGAKRLVLETGTRQVAALALYRKCGFAPIPLFGEYQRSPETSLCLGKSLGP